MRVDFRLILLIFESFLSLLIVRAALRSVWEKQLSWSTKVCWPTYLKIGLPGGELNPGLLRDRQGYWPLYYREYDGFEIYPWGKYELILRSKVSLLTKVLGNFKSIGKFNTLPTFLTRLEFSEPRGPFSLEKAKILRSQRCLVTAFLSLVLPHFAFKRKTEHHFNKNLDARSGSTSNFSRNSGTEGTKFIDLNRDFLLF